MRDHRKSWLPEPRDAGVVAVIEPAFWLGQPRTDIGAFEHYFSMLVGWERFRAGQFGIRHYCAIGLNAKEANNELLAEEVMELLPLYACKEGVVAIGEIGYDDMTDAEERFFHRRRSYSLLRESAQSLQPERSDSRRSFGATQRQHHYRETCTFSC